MARKIKNLRDHTTKELIWPRTHINAVVDDEGRPMNQAIEVLKHLIKEGGYILPETGIPSDVLEESIQNTLNNVSNKVDKDSVYTKSETEQLVEEVNQVATEANTIAKGASRAKVFDTVAEMNTWLKNADNKGILKIGDNLYIRELQVPDRWISSVLETANIDGFYYEISDLETLKVDLTNVATKDELPNVPLYVLNATTASDMASVVAQGIHDSEEAQKKVTFGAGTAAELASVVAEKWGIKPVIIPMSQILKVSIFNNTMATIIYGASLYMNDYPQTFCATISFYNGNPLISGFVGQKSSLYPMIHARVVSTNLYEIYFRAAFYIPTNALVLSANAQTEIVSAIPSDATTIG